MSELDVADWRRRVQEIYAKVRASSDPQAAHAQWRTDRDELFKSHPQSPLLPDDSFRRTGLPYFRYDPSLRFEVDVTPKPHGQVREFPSVNDGVIAMRQIATVALPEPLSVDLDVWWFQQYGGGVFLPVKDGTAADETYGGGRYLLDTTKGADLGAHDDRVVIDLNFLYHPSCRYNSAWECPLAPEGNTTNVPIRAGERT